MTNGILPPESVSPSLDGDNEKKGDVESAVIPVSEATAAEYGEFLQLQQHFSDPKLHQKLIRKLDLRVIVYLWCLYAVCALDRSNAGNVRIYTFLADTKMSAEQFNLGLTIYSIFYATLEIPGQLLLQKVGPRLYMASIVCLWGTVTVLHCLIKSPGQFWALRALLGIFEAGVFQGCFYVISRWYLPTELQKRNGAWYTASMTAGAVGGLIAYAVGGLQGTLGYQQWQWLFIIEGVVTIAVGVAGFLLCPDLPGNCSWRIFSPEEMRYLSLRVKYKDGPIPPSPRFDSGTILEAFKDWKTYIHASLLALGGSIPTYSVNYTLASMVKAMGYTAITAQALTAPPYFFAIFFVLFAAWFSDKFQTRTGCLLMCYTVGMIGTIIIWPALHFQGTTGACYFALFLIVAGFNGQGPAVGALAQNFRNPAKRAVAMGIIGTVGQLIGGVGGANIFIASEAPYYPTGFGIITGSVLLGGVAPILTYWYFLGRENKKRDAMTQEEISAKYTEDELSAMGEHSPLFRYTL